MSNDKLSREELIGYMKNAIEVTEEFIQLARTDVPEWNEKLKYQKAILSLIQPEKPKVSREWLDNLVNEVHTMSAIHDGSAEKSAIVCLKEIGVEVE